jgi:hypothetical protein
MDNITIKLQGGLGNLLFQIACVYAYSKKHNKTILLDKVDSVVVHKYIDEYKDNLLKNCQDFFSSEKVTYNYYNEPHFNYKEIPHIVDNVFLNGYYQSDKYFSDYENDIRHIFSYPNELKNEVISNFNNKYGIDISSINSCSIHIRRGDYLKYPNIHPTQNMNYYMKSIKQMPKDSVFFIFSDDINWCRQNFPDIPEKFIFVDGFKDYEDLLIMSLCKNNVICNSTFSWWAAYFNENIDKLVIAPKVWFGSGSENCNNIQDLYCKNWIII